LTEKGKSKDETLRLDNIPDLPEAFKIYPSLTTDIPFSGIRTSTVRISPTKSSSQHGVLSQSKDFKSSNVKNLILTSEISPSEGTNQFLRSTKETVSNDLELETFITRPKLPGNWLSLAKINLDLKTNEEENYSEKFELNRTSDHNETELNQESDGNRKSKFKYDPIKSHKKKNFDEWAGLTQEKKIEKRTERDFHVHRSKKLALFEGISFVPYDYNLRQGIYRFLDNSQDINMQNVLFRDLLKILLDKCKSLKNCLQDTPKIDKVILYWRFEIIDCWSHWRRREERA
jgi:hypothetical protein